MKKLTNDLDISENNHNFRREELCGRINLMRKGKCSEEMTWRRKKTKNLVECIVLQRVHQFRSDAFYGSFLQRYSSEKMFFAETCLNYNDFGMCFLLNLSQLKSIKICF